MSSMFSYLNRLIIIEIYIPIGLKQMSIERCEYIALVFKNNNNNSWSTVMRAIKRGKKKLHWRSQEWFGIKLWVNVNKHSMVCEANEWVYTVHMYEWYVCECVLWLLHKYMWLFSSICVEWTD